MYELNLVMYTLYNTSYYYFRGNKSAKNVIIDESFKSISFYVV